MKITNAVDLSIKLNDLCYEDYIQFNTLLFNLLAKRNKLLPIELQLKDLRKFFNERNIEIIEYT